MTAEPTSEPFVMWTVYDHPRDFPNNYVARKFEISHLGGATATAELLIGTDLEFIRDLLRDKGLVRLQRDPADEPQILETWI